MTTPAHSSETQCFSNALQSTWFCSAFVIQCWRISMQASPRLRQPEITRMLPLAVRTASFHGPKCSRLNDDEMKRLIIDVVDRAYRFIHMLLDENTGGELLSLLAERDPLPQWNEPTLGTTTLKPDRSESRTLEIPVQRHGPDAHDIGENRARRHPP